MDTPETKPDIVFNDDAHRLPDGTLNLTGQWSAIQTVSLASSLVNPPPSPDELKAALKAHLDDFLRADGGQFGVLALPTVVRLPSSAMADEFMAHVFIVRQTLDGAKVGEYLALHALYLPHTDTDFVEIPAGRFEKVTFGSASAWLCKELKSQASTGSPAPSEAAKNDANDVVDLTANPNMVRVVIEFDTATQEYGVGVVAGGKAVDNPDPFALLQLLTNLSNQLVGSCADQRESLLQKVQGQGQQAKPSGLVVASANTPLPPMPRMPTKQRPGRN